jgi:hypothetical protein
VMAGTTRDSSPTPRSAPTWAAPLRLPRAPHPPPAVPMPPVHVRPCRCWRNVGPAARRMPQLPIGVDEAGFLVAKSDFQEPIGPSFWERPTSTKAPALPELSRSICSRGHGDVRRSASGEQPVPCPQPRQGVPRPLVVHAGRDRALQFDRHPAHGHLSHALLQAFMVSSGLRRFGTCRSRACRCPRPMPRPSTSASTSAEGC